MKEYKVETLTFRAKLTFDRNHLAKSSNKAIQEKLDEYAKNGWRLVSTNTTEYSMDMYVYLFFEK
ncbi:uncharacterized protein DUF4177 [Maribacter spongiicola]|uniref:Uncharacterized protein DUF4177 n=1 Tax=Maribacter spongiicola TaxID=1206753 RepID=A0A4R7JLM9_9FLAO|nr:DUF4177 domain-containing protein [Maribacter spongiicola]TDT37953.1 uncharacterized protein DUF4177 [Maribacter spongiicola]